VNLASLVEGHDADQRALYGGERWHTWGDVRARAAAVAAGLSELGMHPGDRVAIVWPTSVDFVVAYLGVLAAGAVAVPLNPLSPAAELERELTVVEPRAALVGAPEPLVGARRAGVPVVVAATALLGGDATPQDPVTTHWEEFASPASRPPGAAHLTPEPRDDHDLAALLFTSGTAGDPKAAMLTHGNLAANLRQMLRIDDIVRGDDVALVALPLFHVFGLNVALGLALATGAGLVLEERFDAVATLRQVSELGVTTLVGVPTMFAAWAEAGSVDEGTGGLLGSVRRAISGAAALDPDVAASFEARFGVPVWQGYGLTEASPAVSTSLGTGRHRPGSVGRPLPGVEVSVVDDTGQHVLDGDPGEIWVRGPNVFAGYWRDEAASRAVVDADGWLHTGDIGLIGEDGDLFVVERSKDLVIVSGFNVFPAEVERIVAEVPGVAEAVVVGRPDPVTGEAVEVVVVAEPGSQVTADDVRSYCAAHLARYKCPTTVRFEDDLPRGLVGKALRRELRQRAP